LPRTELDLLKPKRFGLLVLFLLILLAPSLLNAISVQSDENARNAKALLEIVEVANASVKETFDEIESSGILLPDDASKLYQEGLLLAGEASDLMTSGDYAGASSAAVAALERFKNALRIVYGILPKTPDEAEAIAERIISLKVAVNRTYEYVKRLEQLITNAQNVGHNCTTLRKLVHEAEIRLENAFNDLDGLRVERASGELASAKALLNMSLVLYRRLRDDVKLAKTEVFLVEAEKRFPALSANVTALSQRLPEQEKNAAVTALDKAHISLRNARVFIETAKIDQTLDELVKYRERLKESLRYVQAVQAELEKNNSKDLSSI
jgi:hypothetical protein